MAKVKLETGSTLDGFVIGELIHRGGMALLWHVTRPGDDLPMVMKVPVLHEGEDPAAIVGFEMEQMIMPRLSGRHVPRHIANGDFGAQPYIVMERISGETLLPQLSKLPLPADQLCTWGARIADALEALHRQGVVHLDIKPSNIMFRSSGEAVLIDFGLAWHRDLPDLMHEEFRLPYGTAPYMAPEQVMGIRSEPRSDLFALGCLLYFFATGTRPFGDPQKLKGLKQRLWRDPVPPRKLRPDLPHWFQEIVLRCLEVKASRRYPSAAQLAQDLRHPDQVALTARAEKLERDSFFAVLKRKSEPADTLIDRPPRTTGANAAAAPIVTVAINLDDLTPDLAELLRDTARGILARLPEARLACLNVQKLNRIALDSSLDAEGNSKHVQRLVSLKDWAHSLELAGGRVTFHVLESMEVADTIIEFAQVNNVDHIILGARSSSTMRKILGSVSAKVASEAPCTVTVVRVRHQAERATA
jgi:serine/threonine protein kinase